VLEQGNAVVPDTRASTDQANQPLIHQRYQNTEEVASLKAQLAAAQERANCSDREAQLAEAAAAALRQQLAAARSAGREAEARCRAAEERAEAVEEIQAQVRAGCLLALVWRVAVALHASSLPPSPQGLAPSSLKQTTTITPQPFTHLIHHHHLTNPPTHQSTNKQEAATRTAGDKLLVEAREELRHLSSWLEQQREETELLRRQLGEAEAQGAAAAAAQSEAAAELAQQLQESDARVEGLSQELEESKARAAAQSEAAAELARKLEESESRAETAAAAVSEAVARAEAAERQAEDLAAQLAAAVEGLGDEREALLTLRAVNADLESQVVQWEGQLAAARGELEAATHALTAATQCAKEAESARDAAANEGRWLRVKLAKEGEGKREAEQKLEAAAGEAKAQADRIERLEGDLRAARDAAGAQAEAATAKEHELSGRCGLDAGVAAAGMGGMLGHMPFLVE